MTQVDETVWIDPSDAAIEGSADQVLRFDGVVEDAVVKAIDPAVEQIAWITCPDQLEEPKHAFLLEHWQALAKARKGIPDRRDLDVLDLVPALGNLMMLEVERDGFDATYRVYGTNVADKAARDWTGFRVSEMNRTTKTATALLYRSCYRAIYRRPAPLFTEHASPPYLSVRSWRRLILPLADGDRRCARFLVGNLPVGQRILTSAEIEDLPRRTGRIGPSDSAHLTP